MDAALGGATYLSGAERGRGSKGTRAEPGMEVASGAENGAASGVESGMPSGAEDDIEPSGATVQSLGDDTEARVFRGGAWYLSVDQCRSAARDGNAPGARFRTVGIRLVRPV